MDEKEGRRRREETTRQIRKNKKEESLWKRRIGLNQEKETSEVANSDSELSQRKLGTVNDIPELTRILTSPASTDVERIEATRGFRRILSVERDPPVDEVLNAGVLPHFVHNLIANPQASVLIFESAWALTNIASTQQTNVVVEAGAVRPLIQLLQHEVVDVREQSAWCLGNIAGDNKEFRDHLLHEGIINPL
jgi:importin subunit alpha-1